MGIICRLRHGSKTFNLNDSTYTPWMDFIPPGPDQAINVSAGSFRNKTGGRVIGKKKRDREFAFSMRILGSTVAETHGAANRLIAVLNWCEDTSDDLYLEYAPNDAVSYLPLWGQGFYRYHIKALLQANIGDMYTAVDHGKGMLIPLLMLIGPDNLGLNYQIGSAMGGVLDDAIGAEGKLSQGLIIPGATGTGGNEITNPYFGHATYDTGWSVSDATLIKSRNIIDDYILFGVQSCKLVNTDSVGRALWMSINTADTNAHILTAYVKRPSGAAISASECLLYYNTTLSTTFTALANGWYKLSAPVTGINAATNTGIQVAAYTTVYVQYIGFEENIIPLACYGDLLGNAWAGTAHASASTRTAAFWRIPVDDTTLNRGIGSLRFCWKAPVSDDTYTGNVRFFDASGASAFYSRFVAAGDTINLVIGSNSITSGAVTIAAESWNVFHYVWGRGRTEIYLNGVSIASGVTFVPPTLGSYFYLGSSTGPAEHTYGTYNGLSIWPNMLLTAEILADYTDITAALANDQSIESIPWLWMKDGDNIVDNCDDSTRDNWCVCGGIPGSEEALTEWRIIPDIASTLTWWMGKNSLPVDEFIYPTDQCYLEGQGTATAATDSDSNVDTTSVSTSEVAISVQAGVADRSWLIEGDLHYFIRLSSAVSTLTTCPAYSVGSVRGTYKTLTTDATRRLYYLGKLFFQRPSVISRTEAQLQYEVEGKRTTGTNDVLVDFSLIINGPLIKIASPSGSPTDYLVLKGKQAAIYTSANLLNNIFIPSGDEIHLDPNRLNIIWFIHGADGAAHDVTDTATFSAVYVTPRWALL